MNVAIVGCGLRGGIAAALLAGAGVEEISLVDGGFIEESDLGSSPLVFTPDLRAGKADSLRAKLALINGSVLALPFPANLDSENAEAILAGADVVIDCAGDSAVSAAIAEAASAAELAVISPPADFSSADSTPAQSVAVAAAQVESALTHRK